MRPDRVDAAGWFAAGLLFGGWLIFAWMAVNGG